MVIRPARFSERTTLEDLQRRASLVYLDTRAALLAHPEAVELPVEHLPRTLVAAEGNALMGFAVLLDRVGGGAELDGLFVAPKAWRRGIARQLVDAVVARWAAGSTVHVVANPNALGFYAACGFAVTGETATRFGPGITMQRPPEGESP